MRFCDILRTHLDAFIAEYSAQLTPAMHQAMAAILRCRTETAPCSHWQCHECVTQLDCPLSCGHRHCPQCLHNTTSDWLAKQQAKLLPVHYYMVTFTLPYELRGIAQHHPDTLFRAMFVVAADVLKSFALRAKSLQGEIGFTGVLHTHNRRRDLHPHIHFIVPAGAFDNIRKQWRKSRTRYLFNAFNLAAVWRARLLDYLTTHTSLTLPTNLPAKWVVDCKHVGKGLPALKYLSRYLYRGVLPDNDILSDVDGNVCFAYQDSKTKTRQTRTLPATQFLWLILQHVLPKGFRRVRDYGLLHPNSNKRRQRIQHLLALIGNTLPAINAEPRKKAKLICPCCQKPMQFMGVRARPKRFNSSPVSGSS